MPSAPMGAHIAACHHFEPAAISMHTLTMPMSTAVPRSSLAISAQIASTQTIGSANPLMKSDITAARRLAYHARAITMPHLATSLG